MLIGVIIALASTGVLAYLFKTGKFTRKAGYAFLLIAVLCGFLVFSPMFPVQIESLILGEQIAGVPIVVPLILLGAFILLALVLGRVFCGYLCPIGAVQELPYTVPTKKYFKGHKKATTIARLIFFAAILLMGLGVTFGLMGLLGTESFFRLAYLTITFWIFVAILAISAFIYRPFCRVACPYGVFMSLAAWKSIFKIRRNDNCIDCGKCEKVCPTGEAARNDGKSECYMCNRCVEICPVGGLDYKRKG
ncbi:MAG: 4Fe-4S binding protein [Thermoplasmata archaeon]|nr:4Fe-4S binding protein [Thermoplasmata archaeon]